jgi:hypothetical protein
MGAVEGRRIRWVLLLTLLIGQAQGLPEVENPIPDQIGLANIFEVAGAGGVIGAITRFRSAPAKREQRNVWGLLLGFCVGAIAYCLLLALQVLSAL